MIDSRVAKRQEERFASRPQLTAWLVVITSFIGFCAVSAAVAAAAYWFVFDSSVPLTVRLVVSQGNVIVRSLNGQPIGVYDNRTIDPQSTLTVADNSQGVLEFLDSYSNATVATATLISGTQLTVTSALRPRFELSRHQYAITLDNFNGKMIAAATPRQRTFRMDINATAGTAKLANDGQYTIYTDQNPSTNASQLHLFNQGGDAQIALPSSLAQTVYGNNIGTVSTDNSIWTNGTPPDTLLISGLFEGQPVPGGNNPFPDGWQCVASAQPAGGATRSADFENGAIHFWRAGQNGEDIGHGAAGCVIYPNGPGGSLDTSAYHTLRLHVRFKLLAHDPLTNNLPVQDVPLCGVQGTECPVMLEISASSNPSDLNPPESWHHGFYAVPNPTYPPTCDTCTVAHEHINPDVWYFYDSGDLHQQFAKYDVNGKSLPLYIQELSVYASGHQYDVVIGEVSLLGSNP
jgi:hypothetical protein